VEVDLATLAAQTHRRSIKSHAPLDALPIYRGAKYLHVARDGRDACLSMHNHMLGFRPEMREAMRQEARDDPRLVDRGQTVPADPRDYFLAWMDEAEADDTEAFGKFLPFFEYEATFWRDRAAPWLLMVHYQDLKTDLAGEMARISAFLGIETPPERLAELARAASFSAMKAEAGETLPRLREAFDHGAERFLHRGESGRWRSVLTEADAERYEVLARRKVGPDLAAWLECGRLVTGEPSSLGD
jgi:aryl sulfotransferase